MPRVNPVVGKVDKLEIYCRSGIKVLRGICRQITLAGHHGALFVGKRVLITHPRNIFVGSNVKFEDGSEIQGLATEKMLFSDNVTIGRNTMIRPSSYYGVGHIGKGLEIGTNSSIGPDGFIGCAGKVKVGKDVMIGPRVMIIAENHNFHSADKDIKAQGVHQQGIKIGDNVWIGANVTILDGVEVGSGSVIGASTILTKSVPENSIIYNKISRVTKVRS